MSRRINQKQLVRENASNITILQGDQDPIVDANEMHHQLKNTNLEYIEMAGVGHMAHIESPNALDGHMREFLVPVVVKNPN